jgi:hypothetical protein
MNDQRLAELLTPSELVIGVRSRTATRNPEIRAPGSSKKSKLGHYPMVLLDALEA